MERVLIVAAHPDDEILGVGATAARHAAAGDQVRALIVAQGAASRGPKSKGTRGEVAALRTAAKAAAKALGCQPPDFLGLPDNRLDSMDLLDVVKEIETVFAKLKPTIVYTHHASDLNIDHGIVCRAVLTAARPLPGSTVKAIYAYETPSSSEWRVPQEPAFDPNHFVEIGAFLDRKMKALRCYKGEMRPFPHARSLEAVEALAQWRGATAGVKAAEAFQVLRQVSRI
jgi:LmbE family N-acetylglucosaminyl deacetylase